MTLMIRVRLILNTDFTIQEVIFTKLNLFCPYDLLILFKSSVCWLLHKKITSCFPRLILLEVIMLLSNCIAVQVTPTVII